MEHREIRLRRSLQGLILRLRSLTRLDEDERYLPWPARDVTEYAEKLRHDLDLFLFSLPTDYAQIVNAIRRISLTCKKVHVEEEEDREVDYKYQVPNTTGVRKVVGLLIVLARRLKAAAPDISDVKPAKMPRSQIKRQEKPGPKPDIGRHKAISEVVAAFGPDWRSDEQLEEICCRLDKRRVRRPRSKVQQGLLSLSWARAFEDDRRAVVKDLEYSMKFIRQRSS